MGSKNSELNDNPNSYKKCKIVLYQTTITMTDYKNLIDDRLNEPERTLNCLKDKCLPCILVKQNQRYNKNSVIFYYKCKFDRCRLFRVDVIKTMYSDVLLIIKTSHDQYKHEGMLVAHLRWHERKLM